MAGKWRLARLCGQLAVDSAVVEVHAYQGRQGPFVTLGLSEGDLTLLVSDPQVLSDLGRVCWRAGQALTRMQTSELAAATPPPDPDRAA